MSNEKKINKICEDFMINGCDLTECDEPCDMNYCKMSYKGTISNRSIEENNKPKIGIIEEARNYLSIKFTEIPQDGSVYYRVVKTYPNSYGVQECIFIKKYHYVWESYEFIKCQQDLEDKNIFHRYENAVKIAIFLQN